MATATAALTVATSNTWTNGAGTYPQPVPGAPIGLSTIAISTTQINLGLSSAPVSATQTEWSYKATSSGIWLILSTTTPVTVALQVSGLLAATSYDFRARYNALNGFSAYSAVTTTSTVVAPSVPVINTPSVISNTEIDITLASFPANATTVTLQRDISNAFTAPTNTTLTSPNVTSAQTGLSAATTYYFRAASTGAGGTSSYSTVVSAATSTGSLIFSDDFKTGYTWGALPMVSQATFNSQAGSKWQYNNDMSASGTNQAGIDLWPADNTKDAFFIKYVNSDDLNVIAHNFDPNHVSSGTLRPTDIYIQWKEYRSATFDFGPTKDWRLQMFTAGHWGSSHDQPVNTAGVDCYGGFGVGVGSQTTGMDNATITGMNIQGASFPQPGGDANIIWTQGYVFPRATVVKIELHYKVNTPGNTDGAAEMWIDGVRQSNSRTDVRFTPSTGWDSAGLGQAYIDGFQLGMSATNGGQAFGSVTTRWMTDVKISSSYIG